jgi:hypothetical protein
MITTKKQPITAPLTNLDATILHIRMDMQTWDKLRISAEKHHTTATKLIRHLIIEHC